MMRDAALSFGALVAAAVLPGVTACGEGADHFEPSTEVVDGVQVATLPPIPDPRDPDWQWELEVVREVPTIGSDGRPIVFDPGYVLPLRSGDLFVLDDASDRPLVVLDPAVPDSFMAFGGRGRGPGELGVGLRLGQLSDGTLTVVDRSNRQIHLFTEGGAWIRSHAVRLETSFDAFQLPNRDAYVVYVLRQTDGAVHGELLELDPRTGGAVPLLRLPEPSADAQPGRIQKGRQLWALSRHSIVAMWSSRPTVMVHDHEGALIRRIRLPLTQRSLTAGDIAEHIALYGDIARRLEVGPAALTNMLYVAGDAVFAMFLGSLWRAAEDPSLSPGRIYWRLFTERGRYLGVVEIPEDFRYLGTGDGTIWARVLDDNVNPLLQELSVKPVR